MAEQGSSSRWRIIAFLGPLVGAVFMLVAMFLLILLDQPPELDESLGLFVLLVLVVGYIAGLLPSIASALVWRYWISGIERTGLRILAAAVTGALAGGFGPLPVTLLIFNPIAPSVHFYGLTAIAGVFAVLITARPWRRI